MSGPFEKTRIVNEIGDTYLKLESDGSLPVVLQDQTSPVIIANLRKETGAPSVLTADAVVDERTITVASVTGLSVGDIVLLRSVADNRFTFFTAVAINTLTITLDSPIDFAYTVANTTVNYSTKDMSVNGASTPQTYSLRAGSSPQIPTTADITRIIFACTTTSTPALNLFGNITALANGCVLRHRDGAIRNLFNVKTNAELANLAFDFATYSSIGTGLDGFLCRLTFSGQNKMGVAIRVEEDEDLDFIIQDDLTGLSEFTVIAEGHVVVD